MCFCAYGRSTRLEAWTKASRYSCCLLGLYTRQKGRSMNKIDELSSMFRKNFPNSIRNENTVRKIFSNDGNSIIEERNENRELIAADKNEVCGTLIVSRETEAEDVGSVGCTTTKTSRRHQGIATNLVKIGTKYLKDSGLKTGYLGYTYTGLDKLYGASGYQITNRYMMAVKRLTKENTNSL